LAGLGLNRLVPNESALMDLFITSWGTPKFAERIEKPEVEEQRLGVVVAIPHEDQALSDARARRGENDETLHALGLAGDSLIVSTYRGWAFDRIATQTKQVGCSVVTVNTR
jgi:hypothetical protein